MILLLCVALTHHTGDCLDVTTMHTALTTLHPTQGGHTWPGVEGRKVPPFE